MGNLDAIGLYLDGDNYRPQEIADTAGAQDDEEKKPECCDEGKCGTDQCGCNNKPVLIKGISGSVADVLNPVER